MGSDIYSCHSWSVPGRLGFPGILGRATLRQNQHVCVHQHLLVDWRVIREHTAGCGCVHLDQYPRVSCLSPITPAITHADRPMICRDNQFKAGTILAKQCPVGRMLTSLTLTALVPLRRDGVYSRHAAPRVSNRIPCGSPSRNLVLIGCW